MVEIEGKMFARSAPRVLKSTIAFARRSAPPLILTWNTFSGEEVNSCGIVSTPSWSALPTAYAALAVKDAIGSAVVPALATALVVTTWEPSTKLVPWAIAAASVGTARLV